MTSEVVWRPTLLTIASVIILNSGSRRCQYPITVASKEHSLADAQKEINRSSAIFAEFNEVANVSITKVYYSTTPISSVVKICEILTGKFYRF